MVSPIIDFSSYLSSMVIPVVLVAPFSAILSMKIEAREGLCKSGKSGIINRKSSNRIG